MKKVIVSLLVIILVAAIGVGGWYLWDSLEKEKNKTSELESKTVQLESQLNDIKSMNYDKNVSETNNSKEGKNNESDSSILDVEELKSIEKFLNNITVNGFVVQTYKNVNEINLTDVFYNYNSMEGSQKVTDEIINEYKKKINSNELSTALEAVSTSEVQRIFKEYTGIIIDKGDIKKRLNWTYLENLDTYCFMHGDTNAGTVTCVSGTKDNNNLYTIVLSYEDGHYFGSDTEVKNTILTLKKNGNSYYFVSNVLK